MLEARPWLSGLLQDRPPKAKSPPTPGSRCSDGRDTIIDAMRTFWGDSVRRRELRESALVRAARFTPAATAAATLAGYRTALERAS